MRFMEDGKVIISVGRSERKKIAPKDHDKEYNKEIEICLKCTEEKCSGKCQILRCYKCEHMKYYGDLSVRYCGINDKVIHANLRCPIKYSDGREK